MFDYYGVCNCEITIDIYRWMEHLLKSKHKCQKRTHKVILYQQHLTVMSNKGFEIEVLLFIQFSIESFSVNNNEVWFIYKQNLWHSHVELLQFWSNFASATNKECGNLLSGELIGLLKQTHTKLLCLRENYASSLNSKVKAFKWERLWQCFGLLYCL